MIFPMKIVTGLAAAVLTLGLLTGCNLPRRNAAPKTALERQQTERQQERDDAVAARARDYEKQGLNTRDARALAESQNLGRGPR